MNINDIVFIKGKSGLGRPLPGQDFVSSLIFYCANGSLPSGYSTSARLKTFYSVLDAEAAGILADYSDATASTATYLVTNKGTAGDTIKLTFLDPLGNTIVLGTATSDAVSTTTVATAIAAAINAGTATHGFTAVSSTATVTITAPKKYGIYPNTGTPYVATLSAGATLAGTLTQNVVAGVASLLALYHYHIAEYFRLQPQGQLWVGFYAIAYTFAEIQTVQQASGGIIRQFGVYVNGHTATSADLTLMQGISNALDAISMPCQILYGGDISATTDLTTLTDLSALSDQKVSWVIGQDGGGLGNFLYLCYGKSITCLGATLGAVAFAAVNENIGWVAKFNMSNGVELETITFANGALISSQAASLLNAINTKQYIFLIKHVGISGSYHNDSWTATAATNDYVSIEAGRTMDKAIRGIRTSVLPQLASPITVNADGTLSANVIANFKALCEAALNTMLANGEISARKVIINPVQNVLSTSKLAITIKIVPVGVAREIDVTIGYALNLN